MLPKSTRVRLQFGPYRTPRIKLGAVITDEARGPVTIVGLSKARIPWPVLRARNHRTVALFGALATAVRRESAVAVAYWWGVSRSTVHKWRRALGVPPINEGTQQLLRAYVDTPIFRRKQRKAWAADWTPERREKLAAANRGRKMPDAVRLKMSAAHRGSRHSAEARRKMSLAQRRRWLRTAAKESARPTAKHD
jgi:hypothetical protein